MHFTNRFKTEISQLEFLRNYKKAAEQIMCYKENKFFEDICSGTIANARTT